MEKFYRADYGKHQSLRLFLDSNKPYGITFAQIFSSRVRVELYARDSSTSINFKRKKRENKDLFGLKIVSVKSFSALVYLDCYRRK